jgi:hypothetical protein
VVVVYGVWGIKRLELASIVSPQRGIQILLLVAGLSLVQNQIFYRIWIVPKMEAFELGTDECLKPIAYWLRSNSVPATSVLAADIGILGYVSERTVYDTRGVVTPNVGHAFAGLGYDEGMRQRVYEKVVHPDYVLDRSTVPERLSSDSLKPVMTRTFPGLGVSKSGLKIFTLYKVMR